MIKNKKLKEDKFIRVIDSKDKVWKGVENLTKGMNPSERAKFLIDFVSSIPTVKSKEDKQK